MIIRYRRIGKPVEPGKSVHIFPYLPVVRVEDVGSVLMHLDALHLFCVDIACDMRPFIDDKN